MDGFEQILKVDPYNMQVLRQLATMYLGFQQLNKAVNMFEKVVEQDRQGPMAEVAGDQDSDVDEDDPLFIPAPNSIMRFRMTFDDILLLADLYMKSERFQEALSMIMECGLRIVEPASETSAPALFRHPDVPVDVKLKLFACSVHLEMDNSVEVRPEYLCSCS